MTGITTQSAISRYLEVQLNMTDDDQVDLLIDEGFVLFSLFAIFLNMGIHYMCTSLRKHCDAIVDPENPNKTIINPDSTMPHTTEIRLKLTYRVAKYFVSVSRTPTVTSYVWNVVRQFRILDDIVEKHQPPQALIPVSTALPIVK